MLEPSISIIVAVRNGRPTIERCVASVLGQSYAAKEVLVIDGASTDGTQEVLARLGGRLAYSVSEADAGLYDAWNKGVGRASGDWIAFLGADDELRDPSVLARVATHLAGLPPHAMLAYGRNEVLDRHGRALGTIGAPWSALGPGFRDGLMAMPHPGLMHRRQIFDERRFDIRYRIAADYELLLGQVLRHEPAFMADLVIAVMRKGGVSDLRRNRLRSLLEVLRARRRHGLTDFPPRLLWAVSKAVPQSIAGAAADALRRRWRW